MDWGNGKLADVEAYVAMSNDSLKACGLSEPSTQSKEVTLLKFQNKWQTRSNTDASPKCAKLGDLLSLLTPEGIIALKHNGRATDDGGEWATAWSMGTVLVQNEANKTQATAEMIGKLVVDDAIVSQWLEEAKLKVTDDVTEITAFRTAPSKAVNSHPARAKRTVTEFLDSAEYFSGQKHLPNLRIIQPLPDRTASSRKVAGSPQISCCGS